MHLQCWQRCRALPEPIFGAPCNDLDALLGIFHTIQMESAHPECRSDEAEVLDQAFIQPVSPGPLCIYPNFMNQFAVRCREVRLVGVQTVYGRG